MARLKKSEARAILKEELAKVGYSIISAFQIEDGNRPGSENLSWWHENTPANERSETKRNLGYLRAYIRISGAHPLHAGGLLLDKKRLWMDRSVISRSERDGYLVFNEGRDPNFTVTEKGREWLETASPEI